MRRVSTIKDTKGVAIGNHVRARVVKNKIAPPFRQAEFDIMFNQGISIEGDLIELAVTEEIMERSGAFIRYGDITVGRGMEKAREFLIENPDLSRELREKILSTHGIEPPKPDSAEKKSKSEPPKANLKKRTK